MINHFSYMSQEVKIKETSPSDEVVIFDERKNGNGL